MQRIRAGLLAAVVVVHVGCSGAAGQGVAVEASAGAAVPVGQLAKLQDRGDVVTVGVHVPVREGWSVRAVAGRATFRADDRQAPLYADGPWLPVDVELWTLAVHGVRTLGTGDGTVAVSLGLGADRLRSSPMYELTRDSPTRLRATYPAAEAGLRVLRRVLPRLALTGEARGHVTLTRRSDTRDLFVAGGSLRFTEEGTRLLVHLPITLGARLSL